MYRVRVILDTEEDVIRDIHISQNSNFLELHKTVVKAFEMDEGEMASFFVSNENWEQGEEISLLDFEGLPGSQSRLMETTSIKEILSNEGSKMIYVYDFLNLWTFYIELNHIINDLDGDVEIIKIVGERPEHAPQKNMESIDDLEGDEQNSSEETEDEAFDDFDLY